MTCNKTCNENKKTFKSVGTIHIRVEQSDNKTELLFTPNSEHSASDGTKNYAVFLPTCKCECTKGVATPICGSLKSVPISVCGFDSSVFVAAATKQTAVEVEVREKEGKPVWTLKSITIPAPCRKK